MLVLETTPAMVWQPKKVDGVTTYYLVEQIGAGSIGFTWDGTILTTNEPKPTVIQPVTTGTQTA
jgi:hypothetical protein